MRDIVITRDLPYPVELVWSAFTESDQIAAWLMKNDFSPVVGHKFTFVTDPAPGFDGVVHCTVLEVDTMRRLKMSWRGGPVDTILTYDLQPIAEGVRLTLRHTGFKGLSTLMPRLMLGGGWKSLVATKLVAVLETLKQRTRVRTQ
jgi:uncharacterized protein YndB with AHSA1/START domain